jgi:membrane protein involved in colicin uptake
MASITLHIECDSAEEFQHQLAKLMANFGGDPSQQSLNLEAKAAEKQAATAKAEADEANDAAGTDGAPAQPKTTKKKAAKKKASKKTAAKAESSSDDEGKADEKPAEKSGDDYPSLDECRTMGSKVMKHENGGNEVVRNIIDSFNAEKLSDIDPTDRAAFLEACQEVLDS